MNNRPIEESNDPDLIGSRTAMERAADQAWATARSTATKIVVSIDGEIVHLDPDVSRDNFREHLPRN
mgnify:CR=1 FL=1